MTFELAATLMGLFTMATSMQPYPQTSHTVKTIHHFYSTTVAWECRLLAYLNLFPFIFGKLKRKKRLQMLSQFCSSVR